MPYGILADIVVLIHLGFVIFVVLGAILVFRWRWIMWPHLPAVGWAVWIEVSGGICPLTPLENWLRIKAILIWSDIWFLMFQKLKCQQN